MKLAQLARILNGLQDGGPCEAFPVRVVVAGVAYDLKQAIRTDKGVVYLISDSCGQNHPPPLHSRLDYRD